jgi:hypothetical protein
MDILYFRGFVSAYKQMQESESILNYYASMNNMDLKVRGYTTWQEAYEHFIRETRYMNWAEWYVIRISLGYWGQVRVFDSAQIENGFPHTHDNVIFLPWNFFNKNKTEMKSILDHEKVHILQKDCPFETMQLLLRKGLSVSHFDWDESGMRRSNPDINRIVFRDAHGNTIRSWFANNAQTLSDLVDERDHPYEMMAYGRI